MEVVIGKKAMEYGGLVKAFPKIYGKTKNKSYDIEFPINR